MGYGSFLGKTVTDPISGTDVWGVSWTEGDITSIGVDVYDDWTVTWNESTVALTNLGRTDAWNVAWAENASIVISGVTPIAGTDTWAVQFNEGTNSVSAFLSGTDTWGVSWSEAGVKTVSLNNALSIDAWNVSWVEAGGITLLTGPQERLAGDTWDVSWSESSTVSTIVPVSPSHITIALKTARILTRLH